MAEAASVPEPVSDGLIPQHLRCNTGRYEGPGYLRIMDLMPDFGANAMLKCSIAIEIQKTEWPISPDSSMLWKFIEPLLRHERPTTLTTLTSILHHRVMTDSLTGFPKEMALWYEIVGLDLLECMRPLPGTHGEMNNKGLNYKDTPISHSAVAKAPSATLMVSAAIPEATPAAAAELTTPGPSGHRNSAAGSGTKRPGSELQQPASRSKKSKTQEDAPTLEDLWDVVKHQQTTLKDLQITVKSLETTMKDQWTTTKDQRTIVENLQTTVKDLQAAVKDQQATVKDLQNTVKDQKTIVEDQQKVITKLEQRLGKIFTTTTKHAAIMAEAAKVHQEIKEE